MSFNPKFTITPKINNALVEIERVRGFLDAVKLKDEWFVDMQREALILESHYSTHIEGTTLSLEQARSILEGRSVKGVNIDDKKELLNYKKTMDFISVNSRTKKVIYTPPPHHNVPPLMREFAEWLNKVRDLSELVEKKILKTIAQSPTDPSK